MQVMRAVFFAVWVSCATLPASPNGAILGNAPTAKAILARALECAEQARDRGVTASYTALHTNRTLHLDRRGDIEENSSKLYRVRPVAGEPFYELLERDGKPATERELRKEAARREQFRETLESDDGLAHETGLGFAVTEAMLARYDFELDGRHPGHGWRLRFQPKAGDLPERRRIDQVLNRLEGTLWIDPDDFGLTRAEFSLREPLRIWAGMLGSLTSFEGRFEQIRVAPGDWLPSTLRLEMDGWAPFYSLRRRVELDWTGYEPVR